jgi:hypothetical protein
MKYDMEIRNLSGVHDMAPDARWCAFCLIGGTVTLS